MAIRTKGRSRKTGAAQDDYSSLKIKLRGKDDAPLTMPEMREVLFELVRILKQYETGYRAKSPTLYMKLVDEDGRPVRINKRNELTIYPYRTAADEHGL